MRNLRQSIRTIIREFSNENMTSDTDLILYHGSNNHKIYDKLFDNQFYTVNDYIASNYAYNFGGLVYEVKVSNLNPFELKGYHRFRESEKYDEMVENSKPKVEEVKQEVKPKEEEVKKEIKEEIKPKEEVKPIKKKKVIKKIVYHEASSSDSDDADEVEYVKVKKTNQKKKETIDKPTQPQQNTNNNSYSNLLYESSIDNLKNRMMNERAKMLVMSVLPNYG